jgi:hypothetical protein
MAILTMYTYRVYNLKRDTNNRQILILSHDRVTVRVDGVRIVNWIY